ncbi:hypothetical protein LTR56_015676 [Elasticomyces elasticus]|nr:hypothetical protein LTR22_022244 [Elasticomyces elasticus]KAK3633762.1 hypothetical protein LTR56_015676 [Elasticomyces elasticus]KAK4914561.1 hypothetical protein LTR49_017254 [Elasticomyces elasticus]KAK5754386.1 hypothetical protein LTS12_015564 [Elasticomyces elasticus]
MPSVRSLLALGLLVTPAVFASPVPQGNGNDNGCKNGQGNGLSKKCTSTSSSTSRSTSTSFSTSQSTSTSTSTSRSTAVTPTPTTPSSTSAAPSTTVAPTSISSTSAVSSTPSPSSTAPSSSGFKLLTPTKTATTGPLASATGMADAAVAIGKYFGTAADIPGTGAASDPYYLAGLNNIHNFNQITPANIMKWQYLEPQQNVFDFTGADQFVALAKTNQKIIRCHTLNWYQQLPNWLSNPATPWTNETLMDVLVNHIDQVMGHFGDSCYAWDVVNEVFNDDATATWRDTIWYRTSGPSFVSVAFRAANAAKAKYGLKTKLYYNDYNIEYLYPKSNMAQQLVANLTTQGINVDGVGLQSHFANTFTPSLSSQQQNMAAFTALKNAKGVNIEVAVTELDVRVPDTGSLFAPSASVTAAIQNQQVQFYWNTVNACATTAGCVGVTVWDFVDTYSWIPSTFAGTGFGDLYYQPGGANSPLVGKAAIDAIIDGFQNVQPGTYA